LDVHFLACIPGKSYLFMGPKVNTFIASSCGYLGASEHVTGETDEPGHAG